MIEEKKLKKILKDLPSAPGIYKMLDKEGTVLYIGKAKDLNKRVRSYFQKNEKAMRTQKLLEKTADLTFTTVDTELEAMILETNLIKQFLPKYNVLMKDDKNYVYIKITKNEDFPRIQIVRKVEKDGAKYIGPKTAANKVNETFKVLKKIFPFRHCSLGIESKGKNVIVTKKVIKYPCLDYYIKRCAAPCINKCTKEQYAEIIKNVENFLEGKAEDVTNNIKKDMMQAAQDKKFEHAAKLRDKLEKVEQILERQKVSDPNQEDKDIINYVITQDKAYFNLFQIRNGKLIGQENFILSAKAIEENSQDSEVLEAFLRQYYDLATDIPKEIVVPHKPENHKFLNIKLVIPKKGDKNKLLEMSLKNARIYADRNRTKWQEANDLTKDAANSLQKLLKITSPLKRIECYDISHLSGTDTVGSMIVFEDGAPSKKMYRKFRLRTVQGKPDDYKSMEEVLTRRFSKIEEKINQSEYTFKKARKKDKAFIEKNNNIILSETNRTFYVLTDKKDKPVGFIATTEHSPTVSELTNLWVSPKTRGKKLGHKLIRNAIKKTKSKRIYIICKRELRDYYAMLGFEEIKKVPDSMCERCTTHKNPLSMAYDKKKHKQDESFERIPDLVVIDGGKGQLSTASKILTPLKIPHIALAKRLEEIFIPSRKTPLILPTNSEPLKLLQRARDEAHRFAISYNKNLRSKKFS